MILLVDDDARFLESAKGILDREPNVLFARNGAEARRLVDALGFSLALVDLSLPDCNGFHLIEELHSARPSLPIIAISGACSGSVLESAKEFGAVEVLCKPATGDWNTTVERLRRPCAD